MCEMKKPDNATQNKIIIVGGGKGGVGKSTVAIGVVDALIANGEKVIVVESDDSNPDVYKALNGIVMCKVFNLDTEDGYIQLCNFIETNNDAWVVVNTAARATASILKHGGILTDTANELNRELIMLWPINRQRDSLDLLADFIDAEGGNYAATYTVKNTYYGAPEKFLRYDNGTLNKRVTATLNFPELNDLLADKLNVQRWALSNTEGLTIAERSVLQRYRTAIADALKVVLT